MLPWETIARATAADGAELVLARRGREWVVRVNGQMLMSSQSRGSEESLAHEALSRTPRAADVLLGGLGLGFTLRAALDRCSANAHIVACELVPELVDWNRIHVGELAGRPLDDPRVEVRVGDVGAVIAASNAAFDAILLDVDNGPRALAHAGNRGLYADDGIAACARALKPNGVLAVWSAQDDGGYARRLRRAPFVTQTVRVRARERGTAEHVIFVATRKPGDNS